MKKFFLDIGQYLTVTKEGIVYSVLGSCLGIIFYDKTNKYGCFCHGFLPQCQQKECQLGCLSDTRYVNCAIEKMVREFKSKNLDIKKAYIALVGSGNLLQSASSQNSSIGELNYQSALNTLKKYGLRPHFIDVGETKARKFYFDVQTGKLKVEIIK